MGVVEGGGGGGGGVDLALGFKNVWDGVYNFFFCPPLGFFCEKYANLPFSSKSWMTSGAAFMLEAVKGELS